MRIAYFDCFAGISGDMTLGALVDVGVDLALLREELTKLPVSGYSLEAKAVKRGGFRGTKVDVIVDEKAQPPRRYTDIVAMISDSTLDAAIQKGALDIFRRLGDVEAHLHGEPLETIHFHEVGAVDSIVDVVGAVIGIHALRIDMVMASTRQCWPWLGAHGAWPPASAGPGNARAPERLSGLCRHSSQGNDHAHGGRYHHDTGQPFWAAAVDAGRKHRLWRRWRNPAELPNLLRLIIGELDAQAEVLAPQGQHDHAQHQHTHA